MPDHEVHEIQLNGKQLVFMFMAATVVSVVIFLCGVMVGRGVRQPQSEVLADSTENPLDPTTPLEADTPQAPAADPPAPVQDSLTYAEHLEAPVAPREPLKPVEHKPTPRPTPAAPPVVEKAVAPEKVPPAQKASVVKTEATSVSGGFAEPSGRGWVAQVQAFSSIADAEALARRLKAKGYRTFVSLNEAGPASGRYRVRIGKFASRGEAETVGDKLQREERFVPWVTR